MSGAATGAARGAMADAVTVAPRGPVAAALDDTVTVFVRQALPTLRSPSGLVFGMLQPLVFLALFGPLLDGTGQKALADFRGQIVVLNFWASWCAPCADEAPILERVHKRLQARNAGTVLGATYSDSPSASRRFERRYRITYPSVRDVDTDLAEQYGTRNLPETFVLDREGRIVAVSRGQVSQEFLDRAIAKAERT